MFLYRSLLLLFFFFSITAWSIPNRPNQDANCRTMYSNIDRNKMNALMLGKYGKYESLVSMLRDPEKFMQKMRKRFEKRKKKGLDPYRFDYSEVGVPELRKMHELAGEEIAELRERMHNILNNTEPDVSLVTKAEFPLKGMSKKDRLEALRAGIDHLFELRAEMETLLAKNGGKGQVDYKTFLEVSYFFTRAAGHFDRYSMSSQDRIALLFEERIQGYKKFSIQEEREFYRNRDFSLGRRESAWKSNRDAVAQMEDSIFNPDELEMIILPTHAWLGADIFHRLMASDVHIVGITKDPIGADGFLRPGGLFWTHDIVHTALIHKQKLKYLDDNNIPTNKVGILHRQMETWNDQLEKAVDEIKDKNFRNIVYRLAFNIHHDRGYALAPSGFQELVDRTPDRKLPKTVYALWGLLSHFGHGHPAIVRSVDQSIKRAQIMRETGKAYDWLKDFWAARVEEEERMLNLISDNRIPRAIASPE